MRLSKLELFGFKSFPDKVTIEFGDGITAVVGPNGCGKSNIIDAIKWVLGEQGPKSLRGQSMQDVIFAGTKHRKPISVAEVHLTVENNNQTLPIEYNEVTISRRLYRSGESEYLINKSRCRLKDITDLFLDTGIGAHAYSVIEQGMVDNILADDMENRRRLFEEAAGIVKYKVRRKETLSKLSITEDHLVRVEDIIDEVAKRVRSLKRQVGKARRFRKYTETIKTLNIQLGQHRYATLRAQETELSNQQQKLSDETLKITTQLDSVEADGETLVEQKTEKEETLREFNVRFEELTRRISKLENEIVLWRERRKNLNQQKNRGEKEQEKAAEKLESIKNRETFLNSQIQDLEKTVETLGKEFQQKNDEFSAYQHQTSETRKSLEKKKEEQLTVTREKADKSRQIRNLKENLEKQTHAKHRLNGEINYLENEIEGKDEKLEILREKLATLKRERNQLIENIEAHYRERKQLKEEWRSLHETCQALKNRWEVKKGRLDMLNALKEKYEGYNQGVKNLLSNRKQLKGIIGTFADLIETEPSFEAALETALGDKLQYVIAETTQDAREALEFLKTHKKGRASFISLDLSSEIASKKKNNDFDTADENLLGSAKKVIRSKEDFNLIKDLILHEIAFTKDLPSALTLAKKSDNGTKFVALSGETVESTGVITGGHSNDEDLGILKRNRQIRELSEEIEEIVNQLEDKEHERAEKDAEIKEKEAKIATLEAAKKTKDKKISECKTEFVEIDMRLENLKNKLANLMERRTELDEDCDHLRAEIEDVEAELEEIEENSERLEISILQTEKRMRESETKFREAQSEINDLKVNLVKQESKLGNFNDEFRRLQRAKSESENVLNSSQMEVSQSENQIEKLTEKIRDGEKRLSILQRDHQEKSAYQKVLQSEIAELNSQIKKKEAEVRSLRNQQHKTQQELHKVSLRLTELQTRAEDLKDQIWDQFGENMDQLPAPDTEIDEMATLKEIETAKEKLNKLGNVNTAAEEEYETENERLEFLTTQRDDLLEAKNSLNEAITKINRKARVMFTETFEEIREKFITTFSELFQGGEADLRLSESDDPLEGDVEIFATPQGKRMKNIRLLSGGEKALTAIALLFSIYMVKPSPFCILDEVDAPLDDANVNRFTSLLRRLSVRTQFIIITHNKRTMEICDTLYGITMNEPGVSRLLSITLKEV